MNDLDLDLELEERLVRYTSIDTQSDENSLSKPSTMVQLDLLKLLKNELEDIGASDVEVTDCGTVMATIPGNTDKPTIAFLAHVDTAPQFNATGVKPRVIKNYNGGDISFPDAPDLLLKPDENPYLATKQGHDIVTASGTTLLGADDKAGVSIIMTATRHLLRQPSDCRCPIRIAFTPDEEIGRGVDDDLPKALNANFAYTFDGGAVGEIEYETFSADRGIVSIKGVSIHPGLAKEKLVNAGHLAAKIVQTLPQASMTPETTADREGFIHLTDINGGSSEMELRFIIRDFELDGLKQKGELLRKVCEAVQASETRAEIVCEISPQYRNMRYWLEEDMTPVERALDAAKTLGITTFSMPIRGGTDGSRLTELGVPTPNLFTGMQNIHGPLEWISIQDMRLATQLMLKISEA